jgi:hypothetical protein
MKFILDLILSRIFKSLDGYKTAIGGIGLILLGVVELVGHYYPDLGLPDVDIENALGNLSLGLATLGIGNKVEKALSAKTTCNH